MRIHKLSQFMTYIRNLSFIGIIRLAVLICLLSLFFGNDFLTLGRDYASQPYLLRGVVASLYFVGKYLTIPLTIVGILAIIGNKYNCKMFLKQVASLSLLWWFVVFMVVQIYFSPNISMTESRLEAFYTYVMPIAIAVLLFVKPSDVLLMRNSFYLVGVWVVIMFLLSGAQGLFRPILPSLVADEMDRLVLVSDTITSANRSLISALAGLCMLSTIRFKTKTKICIIISITFLVIMALGTGSKGPFIAFIVTISVMMFLFDINIKLKIIAMSFSLLIITIGYILISTLLPMSTEHLTAKDSARSSMYLEVINSEPTLFGEGVGSFSDRLGGFGSGATYVHNFFLETYLETGIVGLILLLVLIGNLLFRMLKVYKYTKDPALLFCVSGFVYYIVSGQFSGYLLGNSGIVMFLMMGTWLVALPQDKYALSNI